MLKTIECDTRQGGHRGVNMKKRKRLFGVLLVITALVIMQLPVSEADAAESSASDFRIEGSTLVKYRGTEKNVSVPDTVEVIGESAFENNNNIELVVLPNSVKRIEKYAFWGCNNLDTVVLGKGLSEVGDYAFAGCKGLEQMTIPSNVKSIGIQAFGDCVNLKDISIPPETISIHETAFDGCYQLTFHCSPGTVADTFAKEFADRLSENSEYEDVPGYTNPGTSTDNNSPANTPAPTPDSAATPVPDTSNGNEVGSSRIVGNRAVVFWDTSNLWVFGSGDVPPDSQDNQKPMVEEPTLDFASGALDGGIPKFSIVDGTVVADQAFYRNSQLQTLSLPDGIREIGQFSYARSSLTSIYLPSGVTDICYGAFYHCDRLVTVVLPDSVRNVEPKAFEHTAWVDGFLNGTSGEGDFLISGGVLVAYRGNAREVVIPEGVRVIAAEVFLGHNEIVSVTMPESLQVIGEGAFEGCTALRDVTLNQGLMQIKDRAFVNSVLGRVSIPDSVEEVGLLAFEVSEVSYVGSKPALTYEATATRLSNESYRAPVPDAENVVPGVVVEEPEGAAAVLEGASRSYTLRFLNSQDTSAMEMAFQRIFDMDLPDNAVNYDAEFTDNSGILLTKLGRQALTVVLPVPASLAGQEVRLFGLDRNGQLEEVKAERVSLEGQECLRFSVNFISSFTLCPTGRNASQEPVEISVEFETLSAPPQGPNVTHLVLVKILVGGALLLTGVIMLTTGWRKKKMKK